MKAGQRVPICVLVSGGGSNLQALLNAQSSGSLKSGRISLVISDRPGVHALTRAKAAGIPARVFHKKALGSEGFEACMISAMEEHGIQLIILAGFLTILSPAFTEAYAGRIINVHPSLIPAFCGKGFHGLKVHEAALSRGVMLTGATVHFVDEVPDGGPIILQKAVQVRRKDTAETLQRRVMEEAEWVILPRAAESVCRGLLSRERKRNVQQPAG